MFSIAFRLLLGIVVVAVIANRVVPAACNRRRLPSATTQPPNCQATLASPATAVPSPPDATTGAPAPPPAAPAAPAKMASAHDTTHGRLLLDGHFAQRIGLLTAFKDLALPGKTVSHAPAERLVTAFVNVLAGHTQLQEISRGSHPLRSDLLLAQAWGQEQFPEVSGVCRQLHACDWTQAEAVREQLRQVFAPYIALCTPAIVASGGRLVVDWDLTAKHITTEAQSDPFAAYGHMEEAMGRGYQWAETVLRGRGPDGQPRAVALGGFLRPGNVHPPQCVERLRLITEAALGHPRRRPELMAVRLSAAQAEQEQCQRRVASRQELVRAQEELVHSLVAQGQAIAARQAARSPSQQALVGRDQRACTANQARLARAQRLLVRRQQRLGQAEAKLVAARQGAERLHQRRQRMEAENLALDTGKRTGTPMELIMDSQFGDSGVVADLCEEGYDFTTKAISPATMAKLRRRQEQGEALFGPWEAVSANAEVAACAESAYANCPYPLRLLGYRKHLAASASRPAQTNYALLLTTLPAQERPAQTTVQHYHLRGGTAELLNRQAKSYLGWRGHRLRHGPGLDILGQFAFAGLNFVPWLADTVCAESGLQADQRLGFAELTQMARASAQVVTDKRGVVIQFTEDGGWPQRSLRLGALLQPPLPGFVWPGIPVNAQMARQN